MLEDFLKTHQYAISSKYSKSGQVASEPLLNYMDVSGSAPLPVTAITQGVVDPPPPPGPPPLSPFRGVTKTQGLWPPRPGPSVSSAALGSRPRCRRGLSSDELPADSVPWFHHPLPGPSLHLPLLAPGARVSFWTRQAWGSWWPVHHCPGCGRKAPRARFLSGARLSSVVCGGKQPTFSLLCSFPHRGLPASCLGSSYDSQQEGTDCQGDLGPVPSWRPPLCPCSWQGGQCPYQAGLEVWSNICFSAAGLVGGSCQARLGWGLSVGAADPAPVSLLFLSPRPPRSLG